MSDKTPAAAPAKEKASNKKLIVIGAIVALLVVVGGAAAWFMLGRHSGEEEDGAPAPRKAAAAKVAPTFMPIENMDPTKNLRTAPAASSTPTRSTSDIERPSLFSTATTLCSLTAALCSIITNPFSSWLLSLLFLALPDHHPVPHLYKKICPLNSQRTDILHLRYHLS